MEILEMIMGIIPVVALVVVLVLASIVLFKFCYKQCPPNKAMVITTPKGVKTVRGKACFINPILDRVDYMSLENIQVDFTSKAEIPTKDAINIFVDAVANMAISTDDSILSIASSKFLGYKIEQIQAIVQPILEGNIREIISQMTLKELIQGDKKEFAEKVMENVAPNLRDMGLELTTFNIQNFKDKSDIIANLGIENTELIRKDAAKAKEAARAEIAVAKAKADEEANEARIAADMAIEQQNHDFEMKKQQLKIEEDEKKAQADAAYEIQQEEQRKTIEINKVNADIAKQDKEIELRRKEAEAEEERLNATIRKKADAEKYAKEKAAEADLFERQRNAEAELFEEEKKAAAELAKAKADAEAELERAKGIKAVGEAEAAAIELRGLAEAKAMNERAEAMKKYGQAALTEMVVGILPEMARAIAEPIASVDKISIIDSGNGNGANSMYSMVAGGLQQTIEAVKETTGLDLTEIMRANSYDAKVNRNVNLTGIGENPNVHAVIESASEEE